MTVADKKEKVNANGVPLFKHTVTKLDSEMDNEVIYEFGGPIGVTAMMLGFPCLMYYFWVCVEHHQGKLITPATYSIQGLQSFIYNDIIQKVIAGAFPHLLAVKIYMGFVVYTAICAYTLPGIVVEGLGLPSLKGKKLKYLCNGLPFWYMTLVLSAILHITGLFRLTLIADNFGNIMSVAIIWGFTMSSLVYVISGIMGKHHRMSGNFFYDFFMGGCLNPRIGHLDLKMWAETRVPWPLLFYISVSCALKQYENQGVFNAPALFMVLAHFLYVNSMQKAEECIPTSWDIFYEKDGFMLMFWNMAGVPFTYCLPSIYMMKYESVTGTTISHSLPYTIFLFTLLLTAYYIFDTANAQKNRFRMEQNGSFITRNAFPQLPWGHLKNPSFIRTEHGNLLLTGGWWGIARKPHYTADLMISISWGLITGFGSFLPYFYFCFFVFVLTHRVTRDIQRCAKKYGKDWDRYCERVPYIFIPYVF